MDRSRWASPASAASGWIWTAASPFAPAWPPETRRSDEAPGRQSRFRGLFLFSTAPSSEIRILGGPCGTARIGWQHLSPKRTKASQRGQRIVSRGKRQPARRAESKTGKGESISLTGVFVRNRRKAVCRSVCTFRFRGQEVPQCLRAVGLRPDSDGFRMRSYAPYAVPLKGKALLDQG